MSRRTIRFVLDDIEDPDYLNVKGEIVVDSTKGIGIRFDDYGNADVVDGFVVWIERVDGELRVDIHDNINVDEPVSFIMDGAREELRANFLSKEAK